jgi:uncharacterized protein YecE (DUF72 family)
MPEQHGEGDVRIGTSGWDYTRGEASWRGLFYPFRQPKGFDALAYYAGRFNTVEINNTFYRPANPEIAHAWVERTPRGFLFSVKLWEKFTHPREFARRNPRLDPQLADADVDEVRRGLDPLAEAGKLGAVLIQYPASFKNTPENREALQWLLRTFGMYRCAVELRDRTWSDDVVATLKLLNAHRAAWTQIDEPKFRSSIRQNQLPNIETFYYLRLHGRNAAKWWRHGKAWERYDYLYSENELNELAETLDAVRRIVPLTFSYLNNHANAQAAVNAEQLKRILGQERGEYSQELLDRYPQLAR